MVIIGIPIPDMHVSPTYGGVAQYNGNELVFVIVYVVYDV